MRAVMRSSRMPTTRALEAVRARHRRTRGRRHHAGRPSSPVAATSPRTIDRARRIIDDLPGVRVELVAAATERLAAGQRPTSAEIADKAIERATCDPPG
jgi:hypothetical protein